MAKPSFESQLNFILKKYDETEARNMLTVIEGFATHVANNL